MKKINIIGTSGSGKSTFGAALADHLAYPYIQLDALHWNENWTMTPREEMAIILGDKLQDECWVLDGNYHKHVAIKWAEVDTVIWLDYSFCRILWQVVSRTLKRCWNKNELWSGTGNIETFRKSFFSKDSIILWSIQTYRKNKQKYTQIIGDPKYGHINFIHLRTRKESEQLLNNI